jgi:hypothetical protein
MTRDGANDLNLSYNSSNLIDNVSQGGTILAKYSYLSNGLKLAATDADDNGLCYLGSLVYLKQNGTVDLESTGFAGGRVVATSGGMETRYCLTDHLGSLGTNPDGTNRPQAILPFCVRGPLVRGRPKIPRTDSIRSTARPGCRGEVPQMYKHCSTSIPLLIFDFRAADFALTQSAPAEAYLRMDLSGRTKEGGSAL